MKKKEERSRPKSIPWKEVPSNLQPGESTTASEEDTEEAIYEGRDAVSDSDGDIPRPIKMRRTLLWWFPLTNSQKNFAIYGNPPNE